MQENTNNSPAYDSTNETLAHIKNVQSNLDTAICNLNKRSLGHDLSKLGNEEKPYFDKFTPRLKTMAYNSDEYKATMNEMRPAINHHYKNNSHHPEFYENGIKGMSLLDLVEMICDWQAAGKRNPGGNILKSIEINQQRFGYSDELKMILINTAKELGYC